MVTFITCIHRTGGGDCWIALVHPSHVRAMTQLIRRHLLHPFYVTQPILLVSLLPQGVLEIVDE